MKKSLMLAALVLWIAVPGLAQKVNIDYAHEYDFSTVKSFQYVETPDSNIKSNQMMADRVAAMIRKELREGGLQEVDSNPDLFVTYHYASQDKTTYNTTSYGYGGYWGGWGGYGGWGYPGGGMGGATTTEYNYTEGTLVIDAYDAQEKKMVWRGSGTVTVKAKPEKQISQVENILSKLGSKWDKILAGKGK